MGGADGLKGITAAAVPLVIAPARAIKSCITTSRACRSKRAKADESSSIESNGGASTFNSARAMVYRSAPGKRVPAGSIVSRRIAISDTAGLASQVVHVTVPRSSTTTLSIDSGPKGGCGWPAGRSLISFCTIAMASPGLKTMPARRNSAIVVEYTIPSADCQSWASARRFELRAWRAKMPS